MRQEEIRHKYARVKTGKGKVKDRKRHKEVRVKTVG